VDPYRLPSTKTATDGQGTGQEGVTKFEGTTKCLATEQKPITCQVNVVLN